MNVSFAACMVEFGLGGCIASRTGNARCHCYRRATWVRH